MPVSPTYPGVYVQEVPSGVRTIVGVSTSMGLFLGTSAKGPIDSPQLCLNYTYFKNMFGEDSSAGQLANYVRLFFLNGGTQCYVLRLAAGATAATVELKSEDNNPTLLLTAQNLGAAGEQIRALVTYAGAKPEALFNIELFQWQMDSGGNLVQTGDEIWRGLSMDPNSPTYAPDFITQNSQLVNATDLNGAPGAGTVGYSLSGRAVPSPVPGIWGTILGSTGVKTNLFKISIGGSPYVSVDLSPIVVAGLANPNALLDAIGGQIQAGFVAKGLNNVVYVPTGSGPGVPGVFALSFVPDAGGGGVRLRVACVNTNGDVYIQPGSPAKGQQDLAASLMLGTDQGGLEVSGLAGRRPAPTGITFRLATAHDANVFTAFAGLTQGNLTSLQLASLQPNGATTDEVLNLQPTANPHTTPTVVTTAVGDLVSVDHNAGSPNGNSDGVREKLNLIAQAVNNYTPPGGGVWPWEAVVWGYRLALLPTAAVPDNFRYTTFAFTTAPLLPAATITNNVCRYSLGVGGGSIGFQVSAGAQATDGGAPDLQAYRDAFLIPGGVIDKQVDLFNLMVLAPDAAIPIESVYGDASNFCAQKRAFLLMDPPTQPAKMWTDVQKAASGVPALRIGLVKDYSAVFFPRVTIDDNGLSRNVGPAGAIAGLCARIDSTRGVWKSPAGTEADIRGITGVEQRFSDGENGVLNPRAINTIRVFPSGIVNWGARTNYGDDNTPNDYKYISIRRLALFMEESLYRGLQWTVFEGNDEPLWSQIRLNVGAFMHDLFRRGAFQGKTAASAYFVKCDSETTTQNDQNLGMVNVWVGFAPLKPAEFVILYIQQMAGQIQT